MERWSTCTSNCANNESYIDQGLPPGFRFHPTDEELVSHYLAKKIENPNFACRAVVEADLNKSEPWELPGKAAMGEKEWYFYSARDRKYPTGMRTNRATEAGYWKATGKDREVVSSSGGRIVGMKKTLVFYRGRAPKGIKSNWVMHEYRHEGHLLRNNNVRPLATSRASKDEWVVCRIFHKSPGGKKMGLSELRQSSSNIGVGIYTSTSLPALLDSPTPAASGSGGGRSDQETLMLNAFLHYSNNTIKSEPVHGDGAGSDATFHDSGILAASAVAVQNGITNPMLFSVTSRDPHQALTTLQSSGAANATLATRGSHVSSGGVVPSLNAIVSNTFTGHSNVGTASASNDQSAYHHQQLSSMQYINPSPFIDPLLTNTSTAAMAPLSRLPSDLDTYWLYSDRLQ